MLCPYCQAEMQQGYIQCRDGVTWTPKKQQVSALSIFGKGAVGLKNIEDKSFNDTVITHICRKCRKVIISYGD